MAQKITKGIKELLAEANAVVPSISVEEAAGLLRAAALGKNTKCFFLPARDVGVLD